MVAVVPFASVSMHSPDLVVRCVGALKEKGVEKFVVPCGSKRCAESLAGLSGRKDASVTVLAEPIGNGTPALSGLLQSVVGHQFLLGEKTLLFCPPWWIPNDRYRVNEFFSYALNEDVVSVMLAGWYWSMCSGKMNYVPQDCPYAGCVAVRSWYHCEKHTFNIDAPQVIGVKELFGIGVLNDMSEDNGMTRMMQTNYWGKDPINMVLVPVSTGPMFDDVLGTDPAYRPEPNS